MQGAGRAREELRRKGGKLVHPRRRIDQRIQASTMHIKGLCSVEIAGNVAAVQYRSFECAAFSGPYHVVTTLFFLPTFLRSFSFSLYPPPDHRPMLEAWKIA